MGWKELKCCIWQWRYIKYDEQDITGFIMTGVSRGAFVAWIAIYSVLALTALGESVMDCETRKIKFGNAEILASSLVSTVLSIEGGVNAILSPFFGSLADTTARRTVMFKVVHFLLSSTILVLGLLMFFSGSLWSVIVFSILLIVASILYDLQSIIHNGFLPELSDDQHEMTRYVTKYYAILNGMQLVFIGVAVGGSMVLGIDNDPYAAPQVGALVAIVLWGIWFLPGQAFLTPRTKPASDGLKAGFLGFARVYRMISLCWKEYRQIGLYLIGYSFYITGAQSIVALATVYCLEEMNIRGFNLQVLIAVSLLFTVPGSIIVYKLGKFFGDLKKTNLFVIVFWLIIVSTIPVGLVGVDDPTVEPNPNVQNCTADEYQLVQRRPSDFAQIFVWIQAVCWGIGIGMIFPLNNSLFGTLVPGGKESGFYSLKNTAGKIWSWAPPLIYTGINEITQGNRRAAICGVIPFFIIGFCVIYFLDLDKAKEQVEHTLHLRYRIGQSNGGNVDDEFEDPAVNSAVVVVKTSSPAAEF